MAMSMLLTIGYVGFVPLFLWLILTAIRRRHWATLMIAALPLAGYVAALLCGLTEILGRPYMVAQPDLALNYLALAMLTLSSLASVGMLAMLKPSPHLSADDEAAEGA